jgi:Protein of unknown function (DUF3095)
VPVGDPPLRWPPSGAEFEARTMRGGSLLKRRTFVLTYMLFTYLMMRFGISFGGFEPRNYVRQLVENTDFRKYDDGLRMILDCMSELERALMQRLAAATAIARFGLHRQNTAMTTCFTASTLRSDHVHRWRARRLCRRGDGNEGHASLRWFFPHGAETLFKSALAPFGRIESDLLSGHAPNKSAVKFNYGQNRAIATGKLPL